MRPRGVACLIGLVAFIVTAAFADSIQLTLERGPAGGQVTLSWSGAPSPYEVYRSTSPSGVVAPPNRIATPTDPTYVDSPPDVPLLFYIVTQGAGAMCGNGIREAGEQCDDGNVIRLDGCGPDCKFEQVQRAIWFKMQFTTDTVCIRNKLGGAVGSVAQGTLQTSIDQGIADGTTTFLLTALGITDLSGTNEPPFPLGVVSGAPETRGGTLAYNGTNDLDWWYNIDPTSVDGARVPLSSLPATITAHTLIAGPGTVSLPLLPGGPPVRVASTQVSVTTGASSTPLVSAAGDPPGHLPSENLDPALTSYATCGTATAAGAGRICGDVVARSLAQIPINPSLISNCSEGFTVVNSMLDVFVRGCHILIITGIAPTQPDRSDPGAPVAGAGAPYTLSVNAQNIVSTCKDHNGAVVDLNLCLDAAAYSSFFKIATDRVIPR